MKLDLSFGGHEMKKSLWAILILSGAAGIWLTPPPMPGESFSHYVLYSEPTWLSGGATALMSLCIVALIFIRASEGR